jgi:hypothetical protein
MPTSEDEFWSKQIFLLKPGFIGLNLKKKFGG